MNPPPTALRSVSRSRNDEVEGQRLIELRAGVGLFQVNPLFHVFQEPVAQFRLFGFVVGALGQHVGQKFHVKARDFQSEGVAGGQDMGQSGLHAHRIVTENDHAAALETDAGERGITPVNQSLDRRVGRLGVFARVGPGAHVEVGEAAILGQGAVDGVGKDDPGFGGAVAAGDVDGHVGGHVGQKAHERKLREGPGVGRTDDGVDSGGLELTGDDVGFLFTINE
jgi:hypothetical protein